MNTSPRFNTIPRSVRRLRRMLPWLVFVAGFLLTTGIGATIIGKSDGERWGINERRHLDLQINLEPLSWRVFEDNSYWWVLIITLLIPTCGAVFAALTTKRRAAYPNNPTKVRPVELYAARLVFSCIIIWLSVRVCIGIPGALETIKSAWIGSFENHYHVRYSIMSLLTPQELGLAYTGLLTLLAIPLHRALVSHKDFASWCELFLWYGAYAFIASLLVQKLLLSYAIFLSGLAIATSGHVFRHLGKITLICGLLFAVIHFAMSYFVQDWNITSSVDHILGRTADSYPYAITIGPKYSFSTGQYLVGSVTGRPSFLGEPASYNLETYSLMYPDSQGAMAMAAPVWSYCDVGRIGVILTLLIICFICALGTWISRNVDRSVWTWSIFLMLCIQTYHLTQMPLLGVFFWSYAASYGILVLLLTNLLAQSIKHRLPFINVAPTHEAISGSAE